MQAVHEVVYYYTFQQNIRRMICDELARLYQMNYDINLNFFFDLK